MKGLFSPHSRFKKYARSMAILWTLFIFVGCLYPGKQLPKMGMPFFDKWTHFVLFGVYCFLWLWAAGTITTRKYVNVFFIAVLLGVTVEGLQGMLTFLGRSAELMDAVADMVGAALGTGAFYLVNKLTKQ